RGWCGGVGCRTAFAAPQARDREPRDAPHGLWTSRDQLREGCGRDAHELRVAHRVDGRRARLAGQECDFPDALSPADLVQASLMVPLARYGAQSAAGDDVGGVSGIAFAEQHLARAEIDPFDLLAKPQLLVRIELAKQHRQVARELCLTRDS